MPRPDILFKPASLPLATRRTRQAKDELFYIRDQKATSPHGRL